MPPVLAQLGQMIGRSTVALLFLLAALNKIMTYGATAARMRDVGLEPVALFLPATITLEAICGALVAYGGRFAPTAAVALAVFTAATNLIFHRFWELDGTLRQLELSLFFKNVAIIGALLYIAATTASSAPDGRPGAG
jgi:putative oxidoreductase